MPTLRIRNVLAEETDARAALVASDSSRLDLAPAGLWILGDDQTTDPTECRACVRSGMEDGTLFEHPFRPPVGACVHPDQSCRSDHPREPRKSSPVSYARPD